MILAAYLAMTMPGQTQRIRAPKGYHYVWSDEFAHPGRPDSSNWTFEEGFERNKELQWYQPENAWVEKGNLVIEGRREQVANPRYEAGSQDWRKSRPYAEYTSACVKSVGLRQFQYGCFEVRAKFDPKAGLWPAIWTLGASQDWPGCGEVDMMEFYQDTILANTVYGSEGGNWDSVKTPYRHFLEKDPEWASKFHVWQMFWDEDSVKIYLDNELLNETDTTKTINSDNFNPFRQPHYILLNLAVGSNGGDPSKTEFPTRYLVDYVRVFQKD